MENGNFPKKVFLEKIPQFWKENVNLGYNE
jgi:hypothetical protein